MKAILTFCLIILLQTISFSQDSVKTKNRGIAFGRHIHYKGVLLHLWSKQKSIVDGANLALLVGRANTNGLSFALFKNRHSGTGICISGFLIDGYHSNGILLSGINNNLYRIKGISISPLNQIENGSGILIGLVNINQKKKSVPNDCFRGAILFFKGIQIGIINHAIKLRGIQIGLININKANRKLFRVTPFFNFNFRNPERHF